MIRGLSLVALAVVAVAALPARADLDPLEVDIERMTHGLILQKRATMIVDRRLGEAARVLAERLPSSGAPSNTLVESILWERGFIDPAPHLVLAWGEAGAEQPIVDELKKQLAKVVGDERYRRFGVGVHRKGKQLVVVGALQESNIDVDPFSRELKVGEVVELHGHLHTGFRRLRALATQPAGRVLALGLSVENDGFQGSFRCESAGRWQIELLADGRLGTTVVANFPLFCGVPARYGLEASEMPRGRAVRDAATAERRLYELIGNERRRLGLPELATDTKLAQVARAHDRDMQRTGFVGHVSPTTGNASDRLRKAGIPATRLLENVARAYSVEDAHSGLMASPGHRRNILDPDVQSLGIGVVVRDLGDDTVELYVTELFTSTKKQTSPEDY